MQPNADGPARERRSAGRLAREPHDRDLRTVPSRRSALQSRAGGAVQELLTEATADAYLQERWPDLWSELTRDHRITVREIGDGNLNLVFVVKGDSDRPGVVLKQSMPYVRLVGESWPLTAERAAAEARGYEVYTRVAPGLVPRYHGYDPDRHVLVMEDVSNLSVWRSALIRGESYPGASGAMGRLVALVGFNTSDFGMDPLERKALIARSVNAELCRITEDLVFTEPYYVHEHDRFGPALAPSVDRLRRDDDLRTEVQILKHAFMTHAEALIHGDLHTGSVMVGPGRTLAFDLEFAFCGPVAFDLGALWGNFVISAARADRVGAPKAFRSHVAGLLAECWSAFESTFRERWSDRIDRSFGPAFLDRYLRQVWSEALGFGAAKAIRRIVGIAQVADIQSLPEPECTSAAEAVLAASRRWALERNELADPDAAWRVVEQALAQ